MVTKLYVLFLSIITALFACHPASAQQEKKLVASVQKNTITMQESLIVIITAQGFRPEKMPELPAIEGFKVLYRGEQVRESSQVSVIVNGKQQVVKNEASVIYQFELIPTNTGTFTIPSVSVTADRNQYRTQPIRVTVSNEAADDERDVYIDVSLSKTTCYIEEPVVLEIKWRFSQSIESYALDIPFLPALKNVIVKDIEEKDPRISYEQIQYNNRQGIDYFTKTNELYNGVQYVVLTLKKILIPASTGTIILDPIVLRCDIIKGYQRRQDPFDDFGFGGFFSSRRPIVERRVVRSKPLSLTVMALPPKPAGFPDNVSVGVYTMQVNASAQTVNVGEPVTVSVAVSGAGNIEGMIEPVLSDTSDFRRFTEDAKSEVSVSARGVTGKTTFESVLIPTSHRVSQIPPFIFHYFDPSSGKYNMLKSEPIPITVNPAPESQHSVIIGGDDETGGKKEVKIIYRDLPGHVMYSYGTLINGGGYVYTRWWYILLFIAPVIFNFLLAFQMKRRRRLTEDNAFRRKVHARRKTLAILKTAKKSMQKNNINGFYSDLVHALNEYIGGKLNIPSAGLTCNSVKDLLVGRRIDVQIIKRLEALYQSADMARFVPESNQSKHKMNDDFQEVNDLIAQLEKIKW